MQARLKFLSLIIIIFGTFFIINSGLAATTCAQKYQGYGQCAPDCTKLGADYQKDTASGLCVTGTCCYKTGGSVNNKDSVADQLKLQIPIFEKASVSSLPEYIAALYRYIMIILVPLAIIMIIVGGISWVAAAGNQGRIESAKKYITAAFSGLIIGLFSYVLLSLVGINALYMPGLQKIEPVIVNNETTGLPCDENSNEPRCKPPGKTSSLFPNIFLHSASAKANVPLLKQTAYSTTNYGSCGTIATSGCGITSLTMILNYFGNKVTVPDVTKMALDMDARDCPVTLPSSCKTDTANLKINCLCCGGTRWTAFLTTADTSIMNQMKGKYKIANPVNYLSKILPKYGLKGEFVLDKKQILAYLSAQSPIIVSIGGPARFTSSGHYIVLTGCDKCTDAINASGKVIKGDIQISVNDPYNNNTYITASELLSNIKSAFYIHK